MAAFNVKRMFDDVIKPRYNFDFDLKNEQISVIESVLERNHTVGVFPTGFGKSICFLLPPLILDQHYPIRHICLVISPLKSLMLDQCKKNSDHDIAAAVIKRRSEMSPEIIEGIKKGEYSVLYMSPDTLLNIDSWGDLLLNSRLYQDQVTLIAIDEAHILESWGDTFRPTFARLGELRSHFPRTPFLMLTATCTQQILKHITSRIHLPGLKMHTASPDRQNIYLEYKRSKDVFEELDWLFDEIKKNGVKARKTLVYVRSLSHGGRLYRDILGHLREHAFLGQRKVHCNSHIALYHAGMANKDLQYILSEISKPDSVIRLAICTIAFGMGINIPDIDLVVHWGACSSVMDYWQEVGRAGRDGRKAKALYFVTPGSILQVSDKMKELCRAMDKGTSKCFRDSVLSCLIGYTSKPVCPCDMDCTECNCSLCSCCQICLKACPCRKDKAD